MWSVDELSLKANGGTEMMQRALYAKLKPELRDQVHIICSRVREVKPDKINIYWLHDLADDPEVFHLTNQDSRDRFDAFIFVSHWQKEQYHAKLMLPFDKTYVMPNAIEHFAPGFEKDQNGPIRLIYHTTPHRGLHLLVNAVALLHERLNLDIHLDVFSSFNAYGWPDRDKPYQHLFDFIQAHPAMTYHGYQPNDIVRDHLDKAHVFAYPSVWPETSCIAMIEAMAAGCAVVAPYFGALPETGWRWPFFYQWSDDPEVHYSHFVGTLAAVLQHVRTNNSIVQRLAYQKESTNVFYAWERRIHEWNGLVEELIRRRNTTEAQAI